MNTKDENTNRMLRGREQTRFRELRRPGLIKSIVTPAYCLLDAQACRGASGDSGRTREETRGLPVGARDRPCGETQKAGDPRADRTGGATGSIGGGLGGLRPWGLGGPFWA
ncbi:hypothetical protein NDU88_000860 [Pleurodeles waltl]|uniref:Uncharacterized protein n=1 Tax=Pleurodeles waltl TaxID=8319 RepID=A0AAV7N990_PLEWA|nr:hypothetical protein NDU88_000860 [Pleurodeles waltl]